MSEKKKYLEIILHTNEWFENKIRQLQLIIDNENDHKIFIENKDGEKVELPEDLKRGFNFGIQTAIEVFGQFPIKISKPNDSN